MTLMLPMIGGGRRAAGGGGVPQTSQLTKKNSAGVYTSFNGTNDTINSNSNFTVAHAVGNNPKSTGKRYFEVYFRVTGWSDYQAHGVMCDTDVTTLSASLYSALTERLAINGNLANRLNAVNNNSVNGWDRSAATLDTTIGGATLTGVVACAVDLDAGKVWYAYENTGRTALVWSNSGDPAAGTGNLITQNETMSVVPYVYARRNTSDGNYATLCTGDDTCAYAPPSGFVYWDAT